MKDQRKAGWESLHVPERRFSWRERLEACQGTSLRKCIFIKTGGQAWKYIHIHVVDSSQDAEPSDRFSKIRGGSKDLVSSTEVGPKPHR